MTKGKNKKMKTTNIYLFLLPPLPSQDGGGLLQPPPLPQLFLWQKFLKFFSLIHGYLEKGWVNGPYGNLSKNAKTARGKIRKREGGWNNPPPLLRERVKRQMTSPAGLVVYQVSGVCPRNARGWTELTRTLNDHPAPTPTPLSPTHMQYTQ